MKRYARFEMWSTENGEYDFCLKECMGQASWWVGLTGPGGEAPTWEEAHKAALVKFEALFPGKSVTLHTRRSEFMTVSENEARHMTVSCVRSRTDRAASWAVKLERSMGPLGARDATDSHEKTGYASTWEEAIDAGRRTLRVLGDIPFP